MTRKNAKWQKADDIFRARLMWTVKTYGAGAEGKYIERELGISQRTYQNRLKDPSKWTLAECRLYADKCHMTNAEVLQIMGRETDNRDLRVLFRDLIKEIMTTGEE